VIGDDRFRETTGRWEEILRSEKFLVTHYIVYHLSLSTLYIRDVKSWITPVFDNSFLTFLWKNKKWFSLVYKLSTFTRHSLQRSAPLFLRQIRISNLFFRNPINSDETRAETFPSSRYTPRRWNGAIDFFLAACSAKNSPFFPLTPSAGGL
jgi:hypothetical protein